MKKNQLPSKMSTPSTFSLAFEDNHNEREIQDPEVPIETVAMATKMEDVWHWLGYSRNSEMPLASLEIPINDIVDNFQGAMELMPQEVEVLADKVTKLQHLPFTNASDQEILQFEEILARKEKSLAKEIIIFDEDVMEDQIYDKKMSKIFGSERIHLGGIHKAIAAHILPSAKKL